MPFKFYIHDLYDRTEVDEPRGWKDVQSVIERDFPTHGMFFEYTDGTLKLGFQCDGKVLLEAAYQKDGISAYYIFEVEEAENEYSTYSVIFSAEMDFNTRHWDEDYFEIEVDESSTQLTLKNRSGVVIGLNAQADLDNNGLNKMHYDFSIQSLATKLFKQLIIGKASETFDSVQSTAASSLSVLYANFGFDSTESEELKKYKQSVTEVRDSTFANGIITFENDAAIEINFDYDFDLILTEDQGSGSTTYTANLDVYFDQTVINSLDSKVSSAFIDTESDTSASPNDVTLTFTFDTTQRYWVPAGTTMRLELEIRQISTGTTQFSVVLDVTKFDITITDKIATFGTVNQWYNIHEALEKNVAFITGVSDFLYSELLGSQLLGYTEDGCLSNMFITNGYRVRQVTDDKKAPKFSFKNFVSNVNSIIPVGYGIEEIQSAVVLGLFDINWIGAVAGIGEFRIHSNLIYDIYVGDELCFRNSEVLFGCYDVTEVTWSGVYTTIKIDVSTNDQFYSWISVDNPIEPSWHYDVYVTLNSETASRERLRVEEWTHFYGENELINLGVVQDYSEDPFNDAIYNSIEAGFKKYANDEDAPSSLEEFHTESAWALPVKKIQNALKLSLSWIGSTLLFNKSRDSIFAKKPTTSNVFDNDIFFCEKAGRGITTSVDFGGGTGSITMSAEVYENYIKTANQLFNVSGATDPLDDGLYSTAGLDAFFKIEENEYQVFVVSGPNSSNSADTVLLTPETFINTLYKPEANDNILTSSGLTRPSYTMNQRRTIKQFLFAWGRYIKSALAYEVDSATKVIQNLFFDVNGAFTSEIDSSDLNSDCINTFDSVEEQANILTSDLGAIKFKPNLINGTVAICDEDYNLIKDAHKNKHKIGLFGGTNYLQSQISKSNINFVHQIGIFDITIEASFSNWESLFEVSTLMSNRWDAAGDGFAMYYTNSFSVSPRLMGLEIISDAVNSNYGFSANLGTLLEDDKTHKIRWQCNGVTLALTIDGEPQALTTPASFNFTGSLDSELELTVGFGPISTYFHEGTIKSVNVKNNLNEEIINYNFNDGNNVSVPNTGADKPFPSDLTWFIGAQYQSLGYGYLSMTSPNAKTVTGWLMKMKRNPIDRIAKVTLLERHIPVGIGVQIIGATNLIS